MVMNDETLCRRLLPLLLTFLLGFAGGCGLTIFLGENVPDHGNRAFQAGIGLGQSLGREGETERTVRELRKQLRILESHSEERKKALETVRKSFEEYAKEEQNKQKRLRRERNAALGLVGLLAVALAAGK